MTGSMINMQRKGRNFHIVVASFFLISSSTPVCDAWYDVWTQSIDGHDWILSNSNGSIKINSTVPGTVHTSLMKAGILGDPYYIYNDAYYKWVAYENWTYTKKIEMGEFLAAGQIDVVFEGLDTISTVWFNGKILGETNNMFVKYVFPIKNVIKQGSNILEVRFTSPLDAAEANAKDYPYDVPPMCSDPTQRGDCYINFLRKEQASFSWDWGPTFPTMGIWKTAFLQGYQSAIINQVSTVIGPADFYNWWLNGTVYFDVGWSNGQSRNVSGNLVVEAPGMMANFHQEIHVTTLQNWGNFSVKVSGNYVQLWWPSGHGSQNLYDVMINFTSAEYGSEQSIETVRVGFRTVELVQEPIQGSEGLTFYFKINDKPIYMKGSNWIPADSFQDRITKDYLRDLLMSAKAAHMNILRVWGGGVYESEMFYSLADELGIMIWQDMMFACHLYPSNEAFLNNVREEISQQVRRLKNHPSIAIWAGNNENEGMVPPTGDHSPRKAPWYVYYSDYVSLYIDTVRGVIMAEDRSRPFVSSSPSNGLETQKEGYVSKNPQDTHYGDVHFYDYAADSWNYKVFPTPRFASEYGLQSWCSIETLEPVSKPSDLVLGSNFTIDRNHHPEGLQQMQAEVAMHMNLPKSGDEQTKFKNFVYLTQINQAVGIKTESEHYRRMQNSLLNGEGMTMGSLYWQLNDIWQAPTWASIEYGGKWKMLHYYAKHFYSPVLLSSFLDGNKVRLFLINETLASLQQYQADKYHYYEKSTFFKNHSEDIKGMMDSEDTILRFDPQGYDGLHNTERYGTHSSAKTHDMRQDDGRSPPYPYADDIVCILDTSTFELDIQMFKWSSLMPVYTWKLTKGYIDSGAEEIFKNELVLMLNMSACPTVNHCFLVFSLPECGLQSWLLLSNFTTAEGLMKPNIKVTNVMKSDANTIKMTLTTDQIAPFVWLEAKGFKGHFSDNGFMMTQKEVQVMFYSKMPVKTADVKTFQNKLTVTSLMDVYG